jgi:hypothetical protein
MLCDALRCYAKARLGSRGLGALPVAQSPASADKCIQLFTQAEQRKEQRNHI